MCYFINGIGGVLKYIEVLVNGIDNKLYFGFNIVKILFIISWV